MKTDDFVLMLATGTNPIALNLGFRRHATALGWGSLVALLLMFGTIGLLPNLSGALASPKFWIKLGFVACLAIASIAAVSRLSRPGVRLGYVRIALAVPVIAIWGLALTVLAGAAPEQRDELLLGHTWTSCPGLIAMLSTPLFVANIWAMRGLAPTHLRLAGGCAGLLAGAIGACIYCFHCPEMEAPFIATWYVIGIFIPTAVGIVLGPRLLRW